MKYRFYPEASAEFEADIRYYNRRQPGLQIRFVAAVENAIARILEHPERWRMIEPDSTFAATRFTSSSVTVSYLASSLSLWSKPRQDFSSRAKEWIWKLFHPVRKLLCQP